MADNGASSSSSDSEENRSTEENPLEIAATAGARLSTPDKANISRQRKVQTNPAGMKNIRGTVGPNVSAWERLKEFKDDYLSVVSGKLRCDACKETISKKKSSVKKHILSQKHIKSKDVIKKSKMKDQSIRGLMARNSKAKGSTLPEDMRLYRYELVETLLKAGIPLSKTDIMRPFLEKYGHRFDIPFTFGRIYSHDP